MKRLSRAQLFADSLRLNGILLVAGPSKEEAFSDETVLEHLFSILGKSAQEYAEFDYTLSDLHEKGRRARRVKVIVNQKNLKHDYVEIIPGEDLLAFQWSLSVENRNGLKKFLARQDSMFMTVSEGDQNERLHELLGSQLDSSGKNLQILEVPVINLFKTGGSRKDTVSKALVYLLQ